jgi:hypothetical protein
LRPWTDCAARYSRRPLSSEHDLESYERFAVGRPRCCRLVQDTQSPAKIPTRNGSSMKRFTNNQAKAMKKPDPTGD